MSAGRIVFMFSGQGSHYFQMGRELFDHNAEFRKQLLHLDAVVSELTGESVLASFYDERCMRGESWDRLLSTHPAIFMVQSALVSALRAQGVVPDMVLGASLGMYVASAVAGCWTTEQALEMVVRKAQLIEAQGERGGMIGVLASPDLYRLHPEIHQHSDLAGVSFASHFVLSAAQENLDGVERCLQRNEAVYQRLAVPFAFHSRWIENLQHPSKALLAGVKFKQPQLPLLCCSRTTAVRDLSSEHFWELMRGPIRFQETILNLERAGSFRYVDLGPTGTLATYVRYNLRPGAASSVQSILSPYGRDAANLEKSVRSLRTAAVF